MKVLYKKVDFKLENTADVDPETWNVQYLAISP